VSKKGEKEKKRKRRRRGSSRLYIRVIIWVPSKMK
jgi:hypothetical protein